jgi:hypothetical protein
MLDHAMTQLSMEEALARIVALARLNNGLVTADQVEADPVLAAEPGVASAAGHKLAATTNVFANSLNDSRDWFPYSELIFTDFRAASDD